MLKITITPKTVTTDKKSYPRVYIAIATMNFFNPKIFAIGNTHTEALNNLIKLLQ